MMPALTTADFETYRANAKAEVEGKFQLLKMMENEAIISNVMNAKLHDEMD